MVDEAGSSSRGQREPGAVGGGLKGIYLSLESKWYDLCDAIQSRGVPIYEDYITPLEKHGLPSFPVTVLVFVALLGLLIAGLWAVVGGGTAGGSGSKFVLSVLSDDGASVENALVKMYVGGEFVTSFKPAGGIVSLDELPADVVNFSASAPGYSSASKVFSNSARSGQLVLTCESESCRRVVPNSGSVNFCDDVRSNCYCTSHPEAARCRIVPPSPTPTVRPVGTGSIVVTVRDADTGELVSAPLTVKLRKRNSASYLQTKDLENGVAQFDGVPVGMLVAFWVYGDGYLDKHYGLIDSESVLLENDGEISVTIAVKGVLSTGVAKSKISVVDSDGQPVGATLRVIPVGESSLVYDRAVLGAVEVPLDAALRYRAEAYAQGYEHAVNDSFAAGAAVLLVMQKTDPTVSPEPSDLSCTVGFPNQGANAFGQINQGIRIRVAITRSTAAISSSPAGPSSALVNCGWGGVPAACTDGSCETTCVYNTPGTKLVTATVDGVQCTAGQSLEITEIVPPSCKLLVAKPEFYVGETTPVVVSYAGAGDFNGKIDVDCGGRIVSAGNCPDGEGTCDPVQCGPFDTTGSRDISASVLGSSCAGTLNVIKQGGPDPETHSCSVITIPAAVNAKSSFNVVVQPKGFSAATAPSAATVTCGSDAPVGVECSAAGVCEGSCVAMAPGSLGVSAEAGDVSCATTLEVSPAPSPTPPECHLSFSETTVNSGDRVRVTVGYSGLDAAPSVASITCGNDPAVIATQCTGVSGSCSAECVANGEGTMGVTAFFPSQSGFDCGNTITIAASPTPIPMHGVCSNNRCVQVAGEGADDCTVDSACFGFHNDCVSGSCQPVRNSGPDPEDAKCQVDSVCGTPELKHATCESGDCIEVYGEGPTPPMCTAATASVCRGSHYECVNKACTRVTNSGTGEEESTCQVTDDQCNPTPTPVPMHGVCSWNSCIQVVGAGDGPGCLADSECVGKHNDCSSGSCVPVLNSGSAPEAARCHVSDVCSDPFPTAVPMHGVCSNDKCVQVAGEDDGTGCRSDAACVGYHNDCVSGLCQSVRNAGSGPEPATCQVGAACSDPIAAHNICDGGQCRVVHGAGPTPPMCTIPDTASACPNKHLECVNQACTLVNNRGDARDYDQCQVTDDQCRPAQPTHAICDNQQCVVVAGEGNNECSSTVACPANKHAECVNQACTMVNDHGDGNDYNHCQPGLVDQCSNGGGGDSSVWCHVNVTAGVTMGEPFSINVDYSAKDAPANGLIKVNCDGSVVDAVSCNDASGSCQAECTHNSEGSISIRATVGAATCANTTLVVDTGLQTLECTAAAVPSVSVLARPVGINAFYAGGTRVPLLSEYTWTCGAGGTAGSKREIAGSSGFSGACTFNGDGYKIYSAKIGDKECAVPQDATLRIMAGNGNRCVLAPVGVTHSTNRPVGVTLLIVGTPAADVLARQSEIQFSCPEVDAGSGAGVGTLASCSAVEGSTDIVECEASCDYAGAKTGKKKASVASPFSNCDSPAFQVESLARHGCAFVAPTNPKVKLDTPLQLKLDYDAVKDIDGNAVPLASGDYEWSCGALVGPSSSEDIAPTSPSCPANGGRCTSTCTYPAAKADLSKITASTTLQPTFEAFKGTDNYFGCQQIPAFKFFDTPAAFHVTVKGFDGKGAKAATVTLYEVHSSLYNPAENSCANPVTLNNGDGKTYCKTQVPCATREANDAGVVNFDACEDSGQQFLYSIKQDASQDYVAIASYNSVYIPEMSASSSPMFATVADNNYDITLALKPASAALSLSDAVRGAPVPAASAPTSTSTCPKPDVSTGELSGTFAAGSCSGSACALPVRAFLDCTGESKAKGAPAYRDASYSIPMVTKNGGSVDLPISLVPVTLPFSSLATLVEIVNLDNGTVVYPATGPIVLHKGFSYRATLKLALSAPAMASDRAGVFYQPTAASEAKIYNSAVSPSTNEDVDHIQAGPAGSSSSDYCVAETGDDVSFAQSAGAFSRAYDWVEHSFFNKVSGKPTVDGTSLSFDFKVDDTTQAADSAMSFRSWLKDSAWNPQYQLSPADVDVLLQGSDKFGKFCKANADTKPVKLLESQRSCSPDGAYCVTVTFSQPGVSSAPRGDGFSAQSESLCDFESLAKSLIDPASVSDEIKQNNAQHCHEVVATVVLENKELAGDNPIISSGYQLVIDATQAPNSFKITSVDLGGFRPSFGQGGSVSFTQPSTEGHHAEDNLYSIELKPLYQQGGYKSSLVAVVHLTALEPSSSPIPLSFQYVAAGGKFAQRVSQVYVVPRTGVDTKFARVEEPYFTQLEQNVNGDEPNAIVAHTVHYLDGDKGAVAFATLPQEYKDSMFDAALYDCAAGIKGTPCFDVEVPFKFFVFQSLPAASLSFGNDAAKLPVQAAAFTLARAGASPATTTLTPAQLAGNKIAFPALRSGDVVEGKLVFRPAAVTAPSSATSVSFSYSLGTEITRSYWLSISKHYAFVEVRSKNLLFPSATPEPRPAARVDYPGITGENAQCASLPCTFRLKPSSWQNPACPSDYVADANVAGCVSASAVGSFQASNAGLLLTPLLGSTTPITIRTGDSKAVLLTEATATPVLTLYQYSSPPVNGVQSIKVTKPDGSALCSHPAASGIVDCADGAVTLTPGVAYGLDVAWGYLASSEKTGVFVSVSDGTVLTQLPSAVTVLDANGAATGSPLAVSTLASDSGTSCGGPESFNAPAQDGSNTRFDASNGRAWAQILVAPGTAAKLSAHYTFQVRDVTVMSALLKYSALSVKSSPLGDYYLRMPADSLLGTAGFVNDAKAWCDAEPVSPPLSFTVTAAGARCDANSCVSMSFTQADSKLDRTDEQGLTVPWLQGGGEGSRVVSKQSWEIYNNPQSDPYPQLEINANVRLKRDAASKKLALTFNSPLAVTSYKIACNGKVLVSGAPQSGSGEIRLANPTQLVTPAGLDVSQWCAFNANDPLSQTITVQAFANALTPTASTPVTLQYFAGTMPTTLAYNIAVVDYVPVGLDETNPYADISLESKQADAAGGYLSQPPFYALQVPGFVACSDADIAATTLKPQGSDAEPGPGTCHHGYVKLTYTINPKVNVPGASISFEAIGATIATSGAGVRPAKFIDTSGDANYDFEINAGRTTATIAAGELRQSVPVQLVVYVAPTTVTSMTARLVITIPTVKAAARKTEAFGLTAKPLVAAPPLTDTDFYADSTACGRADIQLGVAQDPTHANENRITLTCPEVEMAVSPIFPFDAVPIYYDNTLTSTCGSANNLPLYRFEPPAAGTLAQGELDLSNHLKLIKAPDGKAFIAFNALDSGTAAHHLGRMVVGNKFFVGTGASGGPREVGDGEVIGRAKLTLGCSKLGDVSKGTSSIDIVVKVSPDVTENGLNAVDASYLYFSPGPHGLVYTLYNGQYSETLSAGAGAIGTPTTKTIAPGSASRVDYYLASTMHDIVSSGSPVQVRYGPTAASFTAMNTNAPSPDQARVKVDNMDNYRDGAVYSRLVSYAHTAEKTSDFYKQLNQAQIDAYNQLIEQMDGGGDATVNVQTEPALRYVNLITRAVAYSFPQFAKDAASLSAFRRSPAVFGGSATLACAYVKDRQPYQCNSAGQLVLNANLCGCPPGFMAKDNGASGTCVPMPAGDTNTPANLVGKCSDGTAPGSCSTVAGYLCNADRVLVTDGGCRAPAAVTTGGKTYCPDGSPASTATVQQCAIKGAQVAAGVVTLPKATCRAGEVNWMRHEIEQVTADEPCSLCLDVEAGADLGYSATSGVILSLDSATPSTPFPSAASPDAFVVTKPLSGDAPQLKLALASSTKLDDAAIEYRVKNSPDCPITQADGESNWCDSGTPFGSDTTLGMALSADGKSASKTFSLDAVTPSANNVWVIRVVGHKTEAGVRQTVRSNAFTLAYSRMLNPKINGVATNVLDYRACKSGTGVPDNERCGTQTSAGICTVTSTCSGGVNRVVTYAGPGAVSGDRARWENATRLEPQTAPAIEHIDLYAGYPYKLFQTGSFSYSMPYLTWGFNVGADARGNPTTGKGVLEGYTLKPATIGSMTLDRCNSGLGFYELNAQSTDGTSASWKFSAQLKTLPTANYFLPTTAEPTSYSGGKGCSVNTERVPFATGYNYNTGASTQVTTWPRGEPINSEKFLCNVKMVQVDKHVHPVGAGDGGMGGGDCVQYCTNPSCGFCGFNPPNPSASINSLFTEFTTQSPLPSEPYLQIVPQSECGKTVVIHD